jgi:hypothetical protein
MTHHAPSQINDADWIRAYRRRSCIWQGSDTIQLLISAAPSKTLMFEIGNDPVNGQAAGLRICG